MNFLLKVMCLCFFSQMALANSNSHIPSTDSIPAKNWRIGLQTKALTNSNFTHAYQLGMSVERKITNQFALESEFAIEHKEYDYSLFGLGKTNALNLDLTVNLKFYFDTGQRWYGKVGYYYNRRLDNDSNIEIVPSSLYPTRSGLQTAIGHNILLKNHSRISVEGILRYDRYEGLHGGLRLGFTF